MHLRPFIPCDTAACAQLFYEAVHQIDPTLYPPDQQQAWAPAVPDATAWQQRYTGHPVLVAEEEGHVIGFGDIYPDGLLDMLYVHPKWQGRGVGKALIQALEQSVAPERYQVFASRAARPLFEALGYTVVKEEHPVRNGIQLVNYRMEKAR